MKPFSNSFCPGCGKKKKGDEASDMHMLVRECGNLLKWMEEQKNTAQGKPEDEKKVYGEMIAEYQKVLLRSQQRLSEQDFQKYLEVRRARHAVKTGMEQTIPDDILYTWMVQNLCDLEVE